MRVLLQINIAEKYDHERPNVPIDLQRANKAISIIDFMDYDDLIYYAVKLLAYLTSSDHNSMSESQKLDVLDKLDRIVDDKLPDPQNIDHPGFKVLAKSDRIGPAAVGKEVKAAPA